MELTKSKIEQLNKMPIVETQVTKSKDRVIHKTIITDIKPLSYMEKVMNGGKEEINFFFCGICGKKPQIRI